MSSALVDLLKVLFPENQQLLNWLKTYDYAEMPALIDALPSNGSRTDYFSRAVDLLRAHGLDQGPLFDDLANRFPGQLPRINAVKAAHLAKADSPPKRHLFLRYRASAKEQKGQAGIGASPGISWPFLGAFAAILAVGLALEYLPGFFTMAQGDVEETYNRGSIRQLQRKLCVDQTGQFDSKTRDAIVVATAEFSEKALNRLIDPLYRDTHGRLVDEKVDLERVPEGCPFPPGDGFANTFEKYRFIPANPDDSKEWISGFQTKLHSCVMAIEEQTGYKFNIAPISSFVTGVLDAPTRNAIRIIVYSGVIDKREDNTGTLNCDLYDKILECDANPSSRGCSY